jgi:hypothetical protein
MAAKVTRLAHKIAIQLHLVAESCTICSSRSRRPVQKLLDTPSYPRLRQNSSVTISITIISTSFHENLLTPLSREVDGHLANQEISHFQFFGIRRLIILFTRVRHLNRS